MKSLTIILFSAILVFFSVKQSLCAVFVLVEQEELAMEQVQKFIDSVADLGVDGIVVDVYKDGRTLFPSEYFEFTYTYDVLDEIIYCAKMKNLLVFFNLDIFRIWTQSLSPSVLSHIFHRHKDWLLADETGRSMSSYSLEDLRERFGVEGYYVSPSNREYGFLIYGLIQELSEKYFYSGIVLSGVSVPGSRWSYDVYTLTEFMRTNYADPREEGLSGLLEEEWNCFNDGASENFLKRLLATADLKGYVALRLEKGFMPASLIQSDLADILVADSNWVTAKNFPPKTLSDMIKERGSSEFIVLDNARDILRIIGYKEMIRIAMDQIREEEARK
ncbi:hypothetical protein JXL83_02825 [candidate division WOR-3 bacterium]|nr:hypothetical protein [candidate division WOR-3 bacterium]